MSLAARPQNRQARDNHDLFFDELKIPKQKPMMIELTSDEITTIDRALVEWQNAPSRDGMFGSLLGCMLEKDEAKRKQTMDKEKADAAEKVRLRELECMRIRMKLNEFRGRATEFEIERA